MTEQSFRDQVSASIAARIAAEPVLSACVCETEEEPELYRVYHWQEQHAVECQCGRNVGGPTRDIAVALWNAVMTGVQA